MPYLPSRRFRPGGYYPSRTPNYRAPSVQYGSYGGTSYLPSYVTDVLRARDQQRATNIWTPEQLATPARPAQPTYVPPRTTGAGGQITVEDPSDVGLVSRATGLQAVYEPPRGLGGATLGGRPVEQFTGGNLPTGGGGGGVAGFGGPEFGPGEFPTETGYLPPGPPLQSVADAYQNFYGATPVFETGEGADLRQDFVGPTLSPGGVPLPPWMADLIGEPAAGQFADLSANVVQGLGQAAAIPTGFLTGARAGAFAAGQEDQPLGQAILTTLGGGVEGASQLFQEIGAQTPGETDAAVRRFFDPNFTVGQDPYFTGAFRGNAGGELDAYMASVLDLTPEELQEQRDITRIYGSSFTPEGELWQLFWERFWNQVGEEAESKYTPGPAPAQTFGGFGGGGFGGGFGGFNFPAADPADPRFWLDAVRWLI